jgi:multidrug efflux pump subunit AcrA (membrane-fusion protein)
VRIELANPGQLLKPAMFARVEVPVGGKGQVVTVPASAVIDSGTRQIVLIAWAKAASSRGRSSWVPASDNHVQVWWRTGRRGRRRRSQLPDRCGEQPESRGRQLGQLRP